MKKIGIIGAGMGGLAAAARLASQGYEVEVFDSQDTPGGKNGQWRFAGYRFDTGPSLLTMTEVFEELFASCGRKAENYFTKKRLDPLCHYWFPDGSQVQAPGTVGGFINYFSDLAWGSQAGLSQFFKRAERLNRIGGNLFLKKSLHEWGTYFSIEGISSLLGLPRMDVFRSMHQAHSAYFTDPRLIQLFDRYGTYNGSHPYRAPATLDIIPWVEYHGGGWAVQEGIHHLAASITKLAVEMGAQIHTRHRVESILHRNRRITGLRVNGQDRNFDLVISNGDVLTTYKLLNDENAPLAKKYSSLEPSSSGFVFYWGMKSPYPELGVHNIFFSEDYEKEFQQIFQEKRLPQDPTVYLNITSKVNPDDAPPGGENWFILINTPPWKGENYAELIPDLRANVLKKLEKSLGRPISRDIAIEKTLSPPEIEALTGSTYGSLYGLSSNSWNSAFNRHPNRSTRYSGLYFCGGSVHPGGGMPLVLLSAKIACDLILKYEK